MRKLFALLFLLVCLPAIAGVDLYVNLTDFQSRPVTNRVVWIQPMSMPTTAGGSVILGDKRTFNTYSNGYFYASNTVSGLYLISVQAPPSLSQFKVLVTNDTGVVNAHDILVADATATFPAGSVAWAAAITDGRYARIGSSGGQATNAWNLVGNHGNTNLLGTLDAAANLNLVAGGSVRAVFDTNNSIKLGDTSNLLRGNNNGIVVGSDIVITNSHGSTTLGGEHQHIGGTGGTPNECVSLIAGRNNVITSYVSDSVIIGGSGNQIGDGATGVGFATIAGENNYISAKHSSILNGLGNGITNGADESVVMGVNGHSTNQASFVWSSDYVDGNPANANPYWSHRTNSFNVKSVGGIYLDSLVIASGGVIGALKNTLFVTTNGNDSTAIRNTTNSWKNLWIAVSNSLPYDTIYVGPGTFGMTQTMVMPKGVRIIGAGQGITFIDDYHGSPTATFYPQTDCRLSDFTWRQPRALWTNSVNPKFWMVGGANGYPAWTNLVVERVDADGGTDVYATSSPNSNIYYGTFRSCNWTSAWDIAVSGPSVAAQFINFFDCVLFSKPDLVYSNQTTPILGEAANNCVWNFTGGALIASNYPGKAGSTCAGVSGQDAVLNMFGVHVEQYSYSTQVEAVINADPVAPATIHFWDMAVNTRSPNYAAAANNYVVHPNEGIVANSLLVLPGVTNWTMHGTQTNAAKTVFEFSLGRQTNYFGYNEGATKMYDTRDISGAHRWEDPDAIQGGTIFSILKSDVSATTEPEVLAHILRLGDDIAGNHGRIILANGAGSGKVLTSDGSGVGTWQTAPTGANFLTNASTAVAKFYSTVEIDGLTASRMVLSDSSRILSSATASGAVPIDADGSATTYSQITALAPDDILTNGYRPKIIRLSNDVSIGNGGVLAITNRIISPTNAPTDAYVLTAAGTRGDTKWAASAGGGVSIDFNANQLTTNNAQTRLEIISDAMVTNLVNSGTVALTDASSIATDASLGTTFRVTLGGNRTLSNPTNPRNGERVIWEIIQDSTGNRTLAMDTKFSFGTDITGITLTTNASKRDFITAVYNSTADLWYVVGFARGY